MRRITLAAPPKSLRHDTPNGCNNVVRGWQRRVLVDGIEPDMNVVARYQLRRTQERVPRVGIAGHVTDQHLTHTATVRLLEPR